MEHSQKKKTSKPNSPEFREGPALAGLQRDPKNSGPETAKRRKNMATIGTFKKTGTEYTGEIFTLSMQAKAVRLVTDLRASGENKPLGRAPPIEPPAPAVYR